MSRVRGEIDAWRAGNGLEPLPLWPHRVQVDSVDTETPVQAKIMESEGCPWFDGRIQNGFGRAPADNPYVDTSLVKFNTYLRRQCVGAVAALCDMVGHQDVVEDNFKLWAPMPIAHTVATYATDMQPVIIRALAAIMDLNEAIRIFVEKFPDIREEG